MAGVRALAKIAMQQPTYRRQLPADLAASVRLIQRRQPALQRPAALTSAAHFAPAAFRRQFMILGATSTRPRINPPWASCAAMTATIAICTATSSAQRRLMEPRLRPAPRSPRLQLCRVRDTSPRHARRTPVSSLSGHTLQALQHRRRTQAPVADSTAAEEHPMRAAAVHRTPAEVGVPVLGILLAAVALHIRAAVPRDK